MGEAPHNVKVLVEELYKGLPPHLKDEWLANIDTGLPKDARLEVVPSELAAKLLVDMADSVPISQNRLVTDAIAATKLVALRIRQRSKTRSTLVTARRKARVAAKNILKALQEGLGNMPSGYTGAMTTATVAAACAEVLINALKVDHKLVRETERNPLLFQEAEGLLVVKIVTGYPEGELRLQAYVQFARIFEDLVNAAMAPQV